jgi:hypothetical protein
VTCCLRFPSGAGREGPQGCSTNKETPSLDAIVRGFMAYARRVLSSVMVAEDSLAMGAMSRIPALNGDGALDSGSIGKEWLCHAVTDEQTTSCARCA